MDDRGTRAAGRGVPAVAAGLMAAVLLASCAAVAPSGASSGTPLSSVPDAAGSDAASSTYAAIPAADVAAIRRTVDAINATAGGPVTEQRQTLDGLVEPAEAAQQRDCPDAHNTLRLDPVYPDLRRPPDDSTPATGSPTGAAGPSATGSTGSTGGSNGSGASPSTGTPAVYLLPVLITIFTGPRITGTDLATLRLFIVDGTARTAHLCVS